VVLFDCGGTCVIGGVPVFVGAALLFASSVGVVVVGVCCAPD
jgi:hypothetical protein